MGAVQVTRTSAPWSVTAGFAGAIGTVGAWMSSGTFGVVPHGVVIRSSCIPGLRSLSGTRTEPVLSEANATGDPSMLAEVTLPRPLPVSRRLMFGWSTSGLLATTCGARSSTTRSFPDTV